MLSFLELQPFSSVLSNNQELYFLKKKKKKRKKALLINDGVEKLLKL
jgi:hypothetical protein